MARHLGPTAFTRFRVSAPFNLKLSAFEPRFRQVPDGSSDYYTRNRVMCQQVLAAGGPVRVTAEGVRFPALPRAQWMRDYAGDRVLFVLPSEALGDCVGVVLFLRAFCRRFPSAEVTVANTGAATDLFGREPGLRVLPLVISGKELRRPSVVIDLGEVDGWETVVLQPVDVEGVLLDAFGLEPEPVAIRPVPAIPRVALMPLASSPLRTLPPAAVGALAEALTGEGRVSVVLNAYQGMSEAYHAALQPLLPPQGVDILPGFATVGGLLGFLAGQDFVVTADSGPAHLTKLLGLPGMAVYTSASGAVLQGRHGNLACRQVAYSGPHCTAPCGLAKLRATDDGRVGCMGSLGLPLEALPRLPGESKAEAERLTLVNPVPCVRALIEQRAELAEAARALLHRLRQ